MKESDQVEKALVSARKHLENKEYKNAKLMYFNAQNQAVSESTKAIIWAELSWVFYHEGDYEKSIEAAENVLMHDSDYKAIEDLYRVQGYGYLALRNNQLAEKYLLNSLEQDADSEKQQYVKYELGKLYFIRGAYDQAYPYFKTVLEFFAEKDQEYLMSIRFYLGFIYYYLENDSASRENFEHILSFKPPAQREASALFGLAFIEFREKNFLNVISLCEKIMMLDEHFFDKESIGFLTAASYFYLGRKDIFADYSEQMIKSYPKGRYRSELERLGTMNQSNETKN
jgi:tetratricopeptide (TPR) repeat protein